MNGKKLSDALSQVDGKFIEESDPTCKKNTKQFPYWILPVAASFIIFVLVAFLYRGGELGMIKPDVTSTGTTAKRYSTVETTGDYHETSADEEDVPATTSVCVEKEEYYNSVKPFALAMHHYPLYPRYDATTKYNEWLKGKELKDQYKNAWQPASDFIMKSANVFLGGNEGQNVLYSPVNVYMTMSVIAETAGGETRNQILSALNEPSITELRERVNKVWNYNYSDDGRTKCLFADSIWLNNKNSYNVNTLETIAKNYYTSTFSGEMGAEDYNGALRAWMNNQMDDLLSDQVASIGFQPETKMSIVSTVLLKAKWDENYNKINPEDTYSQEFNTPTGKVSVDFMHHTKQMANLYYGENFTSAAWVLDSGTMWFILPDEGVRVEELLSDGEALKFTVSNPDKWEKNQLSIINFSVPKFDFSSQIDLISGLKKLGVTDCFDIEKSDFSPLCKDSEVVLNEVRHDLRTAIDEEGISGIAYTFVGGAVCGTPDLPEVDFTLDRPFIFVIKSLDGLPMFIGIVNDPS